MKLVVNNDSHFSGLFEHREKSLSLMTKNLLSAFETIHQKQTGFGSISMHWVKLLRDLFVNSGSAQVSIEQAIESDNFNALVCNFVEDDASCRCNDEGATPLMLAIEVDRLAMVIFLAPFSDYSVVDDHGFSVDDYLEMYHKNICHPFIKNIVQYWKSRRVKKPARKKCRASIK